MKKYEKPKIEMIRFCYREVTAMSEPYIEPGTEPYNPFGFSLTSPAPAAEAGELWLPSDEGGKGDIFDGAGDDGGGEISNSGAWGDF